MGGPPRRDDPSDDERSPPGRKFEFKKVIKDTVIVKQEKKFVNNLHKHTLQNWLDAIDMNEYAPVFLDHEITMPMLSELTADNLREIGVAKVGHQKKLLAQIRAHTAVRMKDDASDVVRRPQVAVLQPVGRLPAVRRSDR